MDDKTKQVDEISSLSSIYGEDWKSVIDGRCYSIELINKNTRVTLSFTLPKDYPSMAPPVCEMSAPSLNRVEKSKILDALNQIYLENLGEIVLFQWIIKVQEILETIESYKKKSNKIDVVSKYINKDNSPKCRKKDISKIKEMEVTLPKCLNIIHGDVIEDRKSVFQGHVASINDKNDVNIVLENLKKERKIAEATHNILAWRFGPHQDCDDDGEKSAGYKLLHLLEMVNLQNVVVVVSRWYGGTLLGPVRFRHINNAARKALVEAKLIKR